MPGLVDVQALHPASKLFTGGKFAAPQSGTFHTSGRQPVQKLISKAIDEAK